MCHGQLDTTSEAVSETRMGSKSPIDCKVLGKPESINRLLVFVIMVKLNQLFQVGAANCTVQFAPLS